VKLKTGLAQRMPPSNESAITVAGTLGVSRAVVCRMLAELNVEWLVADERLEGQRAPHSEF
jgi:hypothetical protein